MQKSLNRRLLRLRHLSITRQQIKQQAALMARTAALLMLAFAVASVAHAQGSLDMSGATSVMNTFKTFALYAGAVICLGSLIFAGIRMMGGRFQDAIPGLFGALFGAGVLGWGAGWISSLTGQSVTQ
ncbi:MAG: TrbC/VirB2 family protein [Janthinobacterium lividum]